MSIHPAINWENTHEQNGCHAPLISDYSSTSKHLLAHECDVALERYVPYIPTIAVLYTRLKKGLKCILSAHVSCFYLHRQDNNSMAMIWWLDYIYSVI